MENLNITGIKTADEYAREERARLKLNISSKSYRELRDMFGITKKEEQQRERIHAEQEAKQAETVPEQVILIPPLQYNYDYPHME